MSKLKNADYLEPGDYENIQIMQFAGGEPLLHKKHYRLLAQLVEGGYSKNIFLKLIIKDDRHYYS